MKLWPFLIFILLAGCSVRANTFRDNDFAEFEEFDSEDALPETKPSNPKAPVAKGPPHLDEDELLANDDDSEFEHFQDTEEFEGFNERDEKLDNEPKITITKVPLHFRTNWDSYWLEILMVAGLIVYFVNFVSGKSKNTAIANAWLQSHKPLLDDNFALVGDDAALEHTRDLGGLVKESENTFTLWCSGRTCCEGMLVELKLLKRQDLVAVLAGMMRPSFDQVHVKVTLDADAMDPFVFALATKKTAAHFAKDIADISVYCPDRKPGEKFHLPAGFQVMSEIPEATSAMLDAKMVAVIHKHPEFIDYVHISDQFYGTKLAEDSNALKLPDVKKVLMFGFNVPIKGAPLEHTMDQLKNLMSLVFYSMEKVKRFRLSKEGKAKADKNRQRVEEAFLKSTHSARAEAAAARREEKRRQEKEKVMAEDDPERQRRWEEKEQKRQAKKRAPKMKQLKVKAL